MNKHNNTFIIRIDDRLIHGQVIVGWAKTLNLNKIIVVNNNLLKDKLLLQMMKLAVPSNISVEFIALEEAVELFNKNKWVKNDSILLLESPKDTYAFLSAGVSFSIVNVGGLHMKDNRKQLTQNIALDDEDRFYLRKIIQLDVKLEGRALPSDEQYNVSKILGKL